MHRPNRTTPTALEIVTLLKRVAPPTNPGQTCKVLIRYVIPSRFDVVREEDHSAGFTIMLVPVEYTDDGGTIQLCWTYTGQVVIA